MCKLGALGDACSPGSITSKFGHIGRFDFLLTFIDVEPNDDTQVTCLQGGAV